ncbi:hypothetical protein FVB33_25350 [Escherichia coli]|nr:hypothetical protein [Escherichia coli]MBG0928676.1 hypothetical protein [Escherichia coli]
MLPSLVPSRHFENPDTSRQIYPAVRYSKRRSGSVRGLTLSGTKTHVKQRFLPLTPLLMVSDVLWSPVLPA